jgi:segregation and condensation protein B
MSDAVENVPDDAPIEPGPADWDAEETTAGFDPEESADWGGGDLEAAYRKALSALDASDLEMPLEDLDESSSNSEQTEVDETDDSDTDEIERVTVSPSSPTASAPPLSSALSEPAPQSTDPLPSLADLFPKPSPGPSVAAPSATPAARLTPRQIFEACLFVGGEALTSKRLSGVLRGEFPTEFVDREIDELNRLYAAENRPYEIRLGEGGYRLTLREEFERIRHKVYGLGPKEVRLSQEALEVLAVVAYHQPIKQARVEELGKPACGPVLRQLVRRELIAVERDPAHPREVNYKTTPRFLSLFGIRSLEELPRPEQVTYK